MSKAFLYGVTASFVAVTASATFFFPVVSHMNSLFSDFNDNSSKPKTSLRNVEKIQSLKLEVGTASHVENPRVDIYGDSSVVSNDEKLEVDPLKTEMLQGEIPTTKSF